MAIRNLVSRTREYCDLFLELGAESLIQDAQRNHKSCQDETKAALRDLGCEVHLEERWKGENKELAQWTVILPFSVVSDSLCVAYIDCYMYIELLWSDNLKK